MREGRRLTECNDSLQDVRQLSVAQQEVQGRGRAVS